MKTAEIRLLRAVAGYNMAGHIHTDDISIRSNGYN
jgi:hypothetical protein